MGIGRERGRTAGGRRRTEMAPLAGNSVAHVYKPSGPFLSTHTHAGTRLQSREAEPKTEYQNKVTHYLDLQAHAVTCFSPFAPPQEVPSCRRRLTGAGSADSVGTVATGCKLSQVQ